MFLIKATTRVHHQTTECKNTKHIHLLFIFQLAYYDYNFKKELKMKRNREKEGQIVFGNLKISV